MLIIISDWNTKGGNNAESNVGKFGLQVRNEAGDWLVDFCKANNLSIVNTSFKQPNRQLYTRTSLNGQYRNQMDYVI